MTTPTRERLRLDVGWRFRRVAPQDVDHALDYEPRPDLGTDEDGKDADARPETIRHDADADPDADATAAARGLAPWIRPSANPLLPDPTTHAVRPDLDPAVAPDAASPGFDSDASNASDAWQEVTVPHDWAIAGPFLTDGPYGGMGRLESWGVAWYRRSLRIPAEAADRSIHLDVDGAMSYATVWLNGRLVGGWPYGYSSWRLDLTPFVVPGGENLLAIRLDNPPRSARWYPGGGLFRNVWLVTTARLHVAHWGTRFTTPHVSEDHAVVVVDVDVENAGAREALAEVTTEIYALGTVPDGAASSPADLATPVARVAATEVRVPPGGTVRTSGTTRIERPALWGPPPTQRPNRYLAVTSVRLGEEVVDRYETPFGVRSVVFDPDAGLLVNGERIAIRGVNDHHDLGALGAAFTERAAQRQLEILQEMGANALRTGHTPPAPELLDLTDRMGILVLDEIFDSWHARKTDLDFHLVFEDWHEADLRAMIRRDRNHPSVVLWGVGNEVGEQYTGQEGARTARHLVAIAHEEDPSRPATSAMNFAKPDMPLPAELDVIGLNYQGEGIRQEPEFEGTDKIRTPPQYDTFRSRFPDRVILGTETASTLSSRGVYLFPVSPAQSASVRDGAGGDPVAHQVSGYELYAVEFGSSPDKVFTAQDERPWVAGEFVWTGFDYLGEPTPYYTSRSSYSGIIDLAGFPKDRYWLYQSRWRPDLPMAHLLPHWTWPGREGLVTPVHVFTSGDEAELFVDGVSQGRRRKGPGEYRLRWDEVRYVPGELRVQTYRDGEPWAHDVVRTAGASHRLELEVDRARIGADGHDVAYVSARILDVAGIPVPTADVVVRFEANGPGEVVATDNGDPTDMTAFPSPERRAFSGRVLAIVRGRRGCVGEVRVTASADGLVGAEVSIGLDPAG